MKKLIILLATLAMTVAVNARQAILVAHYGSSDDETRTLTIDRITSDIRTAFPDIEVRQAYISPVVRRALAKRNLTVDSPTEALIKLCAQGYDTVFVQPTTIIDGAEMAEVRNCVAKVKPFFSEIRLGRSLCYSPDDCRQVVDILLQESVQTGEAVVYVGHGNMLPSTATYAQLDLMLSAASEGTFMMSTIEGYPDVTLTAEMLKQRGKAVDKVKLIPFLLVCGNHTRNDIAGDFARTLGEAGFRTEVVMRGLAENPLIRQIYVGRLCDLISERHEK